MADAMPTIAKKITAIVNVSIYSSSFSGVIIRAAMSIRARPPRTINALKGYEAFRQQCIYANSILNYFKQHIRCFVTSV